MLSGFLSPEIRVWRPSTFSVRRRRRGRVNNFSVFFPHTSFHSLPPTITHLAIPKPHTVHYNIYTFCHVDPQSSSPSRSIDHLLLWIVWHDGIIITIPLHNKYYMYIRCTYILLYTSIKYYSERRARRRSYYIILLLLLLFAAAIMCTQTTTTTTLIWEYLKFPLVFRYRPYIHICIYVVYTVYYNTLHPSGGCVSGVSC